MKKHEPTRRDFLKSGVGGLTAFALPAQAAAAFDVEEITVVELQAKMKKGELTSRRLCEMYLERIREIDPKLKSVLEINPDALALADQLDKERKRGRIRSPLHGIPVLIKDNINTADKMKTTAGSLALVDARFRASLIGSSAPRSRATLISMPSLAFSSRSMMMTRSAGTA